MNDKIASLQIGRLKLPLREHGKNPRIHPAPGTEEWELLRASLTDAYFDPLVWNVRNEKLVSGHLRQKVMLAEGFTHADCVVVDWEEPQHLARMIAANRGMGEDDEGGLRLILGELEEVGFDLKLSGLTSEVFSALPFAISREETKASEDAPSPLTAPASHIRLVQLFLTVDTHPQFMEKVEGLMKRYGVTSITDAVVKAIENEHAATI